MTRSPVPSPESWQITAWTNRAMLRNPGHAKPGLASNPLSAPSKLWPSSAQMSRQSDRLKCFAGGLIKFHERLPCHDEPIVSLVLPVDATNIWPLGVDLASFQ